MTSQATCEQCGRDVDAGAVFCAFCGSNVSGAQANAKTRMVSASATQQLQNQLLTRLRDATAGEYQVLSELGRGGMATVYLAHDLQLTRKVAIKVMLPTLLEGEGMAERFQLEARTAAQLSHPHIIPIYAVRDIDDLIFFVMKFVEGRPLDSINKELGQVPVRMAQSIIGKVAEALGYAHRRGVVHRDIKPANLMIDVEGLPVVTDFGIAKVSDTRGLTMTGATVGTPHYMSPEQCMAGKITGASDQYSLGVVFYEMLVGELPFQGDSIVSLLYKHVHEAPPSIAEKRPDVSPELHAAVMRMLAKDPADRFPSMEAAVEAIGSVSLAFDDPLRTQLMAMARKGVNLEILKRVSTPRSPTPTRSKQTIKKTGVSPAGGDDASAARTMRTTPTPVPGVPAAKPKKTVLWASIGAAVVVLGVAAWLKPWQRAVVPAAAPAAASNVAMLSIEPGGGALDVGATKQLTAATRDSAGQPVPAALAQVRWSSSDTTIASVSQGGMVTGLAPGTARIVAVAGTARNMTEFSVAAPIAAPTADAGPATRIQVQGTPATLDVGGTAQLRGIPLDERGGAAADRNVSWSASPASIATISRTGVISGVAPGEVTITARSGSVSQQVRLRIVAPTAVATPTPTPGPARPASIAVAAPPAMAVGASTRLSAIVTGTDGSQMSAPVAWRSANPAVATVSDGVVTAVGAGTTSITASVEGRETSVSVTVNAPVTAALPPPPPAPTPVEANPREAVAAVIQDYARALESRQVSELRRVYPGMTSAQESQLAQALPAMDQLNVVLRIGTLNVQGDVATAAVTGEYQFVSRENRRNERLPVRFNATLERGPSGWRIRSIQ